MVSGSESEKMYRSKVVYFERPITSNLAYDYELVSLMSPSEFTVKIKDPLSAEFEGRLESLLKEYGNEALAHGKIMHVEPQMLYEMMPVLVGDNTDVGNIGTGSLKRAEVLFIKGNDIQVMLVDHGGVIKTTLENLFAITVDILRIPKLGFNCQLSRVAPLGGKDWEESANYKDDFVGKESRTVTFHNYFPKTKSFEVSLEVDKVNLALKYFVAGKWNPVSLTSFPRTVNGQMTYPLSDFTRWIGAKVPTFGTKVFCDRDGTVKCALQMQPDMVNTIQDLIAAHVEKLSDVKKQAPFDKKPGTMCLARFGEDEYFRAIIIGCAEGSENYTVDYVDYKDTSVVAATDMIKLPEELTAYPEGAVVCVVADFISSSCNDLEKLRDLVENKDLYAIVDGYDLTLSGRLGTELLVSLFEPSEISESGVPNSPDKSFSEIFDIENRPPMVMEILQMMDTVTEQLEAVFLIHKLPEENIFHYEATVFNSGESIWVQFPEEIDFTARISAEMEHFYSNGGCDEAIEAELNTGMCVAVENVQDRFWYRGKVLQVAGSQLLVRYLDYGNTDWIKRTEVHPLHSYFAKDHVMALELGVK